MGHLLDSDENWLFYKAEKYERPSEDELKNLKGIIFPGSQYGIKKKLPIDDKVIKNLIHKNE